ncbi:uncharacterized protein G2W53_020469 [Senna tora]|uniref:Uncharacterized protein n=1 Tax=Senna tora TaxID=362788 RepID=A0A834TVI8_9FABA|nr:uncharacterized protein G2W53_020469 [Senna tora]
MGFESDPSSKTMWDSKQTRISGIEKGCWLGKGSHKEGKKKGKYKKRVPQCRTAPPLGGREEGPPQPYVALPSSVLTFSVSVSPSSVPHNYTIAIYIIKGKLKLALTDRGKSKRRCRFEERKFGVASGNDEKWAQDKHVGWELALELHAGMRIIP